MNYTKQFLYLIGAAFFLVLGCSATKNAQTDPQPAPSGKTAAKNILFIAIDDLKPLINAYGYSQMHTPNFDRLAKQGVAFKNANVQYAVCGPSRASIMTGAYPDNTKVWDLHTDFRESAPDLQSMPEYLIEQGYESTGVGKIYHKGSSAPGHDGKSWSIPHTIPEDFDTKYGTPAFNYYQNENTKAEMDRLTAEAVAKGKKRNGQKRNYVFKKLKPSTESADVSDEAYQDGLYTKEAIKKMAMLKEGEKPFFLAVGYQKPHLPFIAPKKYWDLYDREKIDLAGFRALSEGTPKFAFHNFGELRAFSDIDNDLRQGTELSEAKQRELIHGYMACISYVDAQLGKLLDAVETMGLSENTIVMLWGDHGYHLGDHTLWCKHSNFEQATRIPLMFAGPGIEKGVMSDVPVELVDVFPTLFDLVGVPKPDQADGKSLVPLMDNDPNTNVEVDYAVSQYKRRKSIMGYSIRTERFRYTEWHDNNYRSFKPYSEKNIIATELYDYETDPLETKNHVDEKAYAKEVKILKAKLENHLTTDKRVGEVKTKDQSKSVTTVATSNTVASNNNSTKQPNILFIHTDDFGYHDLSCTGSKIYQTPNIDALAASGLSFEQAYSSYPRCTPSRYGLMTATYPVNEDHGHLGGIAPENNCVMLLDEEGYNTSYVGKWHLGDKENAPKSYGFDHSFAAGKTGGVSSRFYPFNTAKAIAKGKKDKLIEDADEIGKEGDYISDLLTDQTIDFIKNRDQTKPFFAMLAYYAVHTPLEAKPEDKARNAKEIAAFDYGDGPEYIKEGDGRRKMRQDDPDYAGMVENVDENVGRLLQLLEELNLDENTIVVFSSDHGGLSNDGNKRERHLATTNLPLKAGKGHLYEGGIRVPLFIKWPGKLKPQVDKENIVLGMDVLPTLLDFATGKKANVVDGKSYNAVLQNKESWKGRTVFWHSRKARPHSTGDSKCSVIRKGNYKLMHFFKEDRVELYDVRNDVGEENDLSKKETERASEMLAELKSWKKEYLTPEKMDMKKRAKQAKKASAGK